MARETTNIPIGPIFSGRPCRGIVHVIENGDTLYLLGKKYHISVTQIMYANPYVNIYNLQVGDELCIPVRMQNVPEEMGMEMEPETEMGMGMEDRRQMENRNRREMEEE